MNLRAAANAITRGVNPNIQATLRRSAGYTTGPSGKRTPDYAPDEPVTLQEQALTAHDIQHLDSLNIQGTLASYWIDGAVSAADRRSGAGGDLLIIGGVTWLVVEMLENWRQSGWCHFAAQKQID